MNPKFLKLMKAKKKREVDPNAPPRPTLLGHEKELKDWRERFQSLEQANAEKDSELALLKRKINRLENQLDSIVSYINSKLRK